MRPLPIGRPVLAAALTLAASAFLACHADVKPPPLGAPTETMSDADHGAASAAVDAMETLARDAEPDTEVHLELSPARQATSDDSARADVLLVGMRNSLLKYADVRVAAADGFEEMPGATGKRTIHHLSNFDWAADEARRFDPSKPTSLLYREGADGALKLVGAMYTASASATPDDLNLRIPLGLARWHQHVNWCTPRVVSGAQWLATQDGTQIYGPRSPIATREACEAAGGVFYPRVYGWMVHVTIVGSDDPSIVWGRTPAPAGDSTTPARDTAGRQPVSAVAQAPVVTRKPPTAIPPLLATNRPRPVATAPNTAPPNAAATVPAVASIRPPTTLAPAATPGAGNPGPNRGPAPTSGTFRSAFSQIAYDRYMPAPGGQHPAVLLLHDGNGPQPQAGLFQNLATTLTQHGYVVEVVHYFDRTGTAVADADARRTQFRQWVAAVHDALYDIADAPGVDGNKLGVLGTGLGATVALTLASQEPRVKAVVDYSGSIPARAAPLITHMPPVLIAHGDQDKGVPITEAYRIRAICQAVGSPFELEVLKSQGHGFRGPDAQTLHQKTVAFFDQYVKSAR